MISAFGVEHGEFSKGLPRYLKDNASKYADQTRRFRGGEPLKRSDYTYGRIKAHQYGKDASKKNAEWKKLDIKPQAQGIKAAVKGKEAMREEVRTSAKKGRMSRAISQKAVDDNKQPFRTLP